ncbi:MAG: alpha/beta hydrolase [Acidobacteriota bacterium]
MTDERLATARAQAAAISAEDYEKVKNLAGMVKPLRSFHHKTPSDHGLEGWEDVYFPSADGVPLEGWYIPATGEPSDRLVLFNHPLPMCRSGFPGHFGAPWDSFDAVEIDFVLQMKHLADAGFNVLAYDLRNHGTSGAANGGICGIGRWEWRDCVGVKRYVDAHPTLSAMKIGFYSQCTGGNAQYEAIHRHPERFENVACMCSPLVVSMDALLLAFSELMGIADYQALIDLEMVKLGGFTAAAMTPHPFAPSVTMPILMLQVLNDSWTKNPEDAQKTFDLLGSAEKELIWIRDTEKRFRDGYNYFGRHPEAIIAFFKKHLG